MAIELHVPDVEFAFRERNEQSGNMDWVVRSTADIFLNKRVVVFSLPGAFTPTCTSTHLPGFEIRYDAILEEDVDEVYCLSVNDAFVMNAWLDSLAIEKVKALPDGNGDFTRHMGMLVKKEHLGFGYRSHRYAMVVDNGRIESIWSESNKEDNFKGDPFRVSSSENVLDYLRQVRDARRTAIAEFTAAEEVEETQETADETN